MTECLYLALDQIEVSSDRAKDFDPAWAEALAAIIAQQGLLHQGLIQHVGSLSHCIRCGNL